MSENKLTRRQFLVRSSMAGAAVLLGTSCTTISRNVMANEGSMKFMGNTKDPMIWFEVTKDNLFKLHSPKVEMGQGTFTGLAQLVAEEMNLDMSQIEVVHAVSNQGNIDGMSTGGSTSVNSLYKPLRQLGAKMRVMLIDKAAEKMGVSADGLTMKNGEVVGSNGSMKLGEIVDGVTEWKVPKKVALKPRSEYTVIGKPVPRVDLKDKVLGEPIFGMDAEMDNMLYGSICRPTKVGATYVDADISEAENMPGVVKIVKEDDFVGVVAKTLPEAEMARRKIKVEWDVPKVWQTQEIKDMIQVGKGKKRNFQKKGNATKILDDAAESEVITAEYNTPIGAHAQIEPNGAVAYVNGDKATVMISTQVVKITRNEVAKALGLKKDNVTVIPTFLGGGFGRRLHTPNAIKAAKMSKAVGQPVKVFLDRRQEFQHDTFRPPTHNVLRGKLTADGRIEAIEHLLASGDTAFHSALVPDAAIPVVGVDVGSARGGTIMYNGIENRSATAWRVTLPFQTSWWRALGVFPNTFAIESFMDELAVKAGKDPIQFRLDHLKEDSETSKRIADVIKKVRDMSNWSDGAKSGRALGFACCIDGPTPVAQVAEVSIDEGEIKVHQVWCAIDCGFAVNPDQVKAQCEGAIIMSMSGGLYEEMFVKDGSLWPTIYGPYKMARLRHAPKEIHTEIIDSGDEPLPVGEPPMGPITAAIANAVFRLNGQRLRDMPLKLG